MYSFKRCNLIRWVTIISSQKLFNDQDAIEFIELNFFNLSISGKEHQFEILRFIIGQKKAA